MIFGPADAGMGILAVMLVAAMIVGMAFVGIVSVLAAWMRTHDFAEFAGVMSIATSMTAPALLSWLTGVPISGRLIAAFSVPGWLGLIALMVSAARRIQWPAGYCQACGYDLRGNREAKNCPECGAALHPQTNCEVPREV